MPKLKRKAALHVKDIKSQIDKHQRIVIKDNNFITGEIRVLRRSLGDIKDQFRVTFENSELGRMKRLLPLHERAVNFGLVSNHDVNPREYLNDIISRMPYMGRASHEQLVELLPHKWKLIPHEPAVTLPTDGKPFVTKVYR